MVGVFGDAQDPNPSEQLLIVIVDYSSPANTRERSARVNNPDILDTDSVRQTSRLVSSFYGTSSPGPQVPAQIGAKALSKPTDLCPIEAWAI